MASVIDPSTTYTIDDFIEEGKSDDMTYCNYSILRNSELGVFCDTNILDFYLDEIKQISLRVETFSEEEIARYKYHPDLLAYDIYRSTQLDFVILLVNGIIDPKEFDFKRGYLLIPRKTDLFNLLEEINNAEHQWIGIL